MLTAKPPSPIPYIVVTLVLLGAGHWWFNLYKPVPPIAQPSPSPAVPAAQFPPPTTVPAGTQVRIDGSTTLVTVNDNLKRSFEQQFPGTRVTATASGSTKGIEKLLAGEIDLAAVSRSLTPQEQAQGLQAVPIASDAIALVVGKDNPFKGSLTDAQVKAIFTGKLTNWSQVGGEPGALRVINRPPISGTHQTFRERVLQKENFGKTPNITTLSQDATTPLLRSLGTDGIGYATYVQIANQKTVRPVPVDGMPPTHPQYPYQRTLFYVYKDPASPAVKAFLGFTSSPNGQKAIFSEN